MATSKKNAAAAAAAKALAGGRSAKSIAAGDLGAPAVKRSPRRTARSYPIPSPLSNPPGPTQRRPARHGPQPAYGLSGEPSLPETVDDEMIARLVAEAEQGIPADKLRRRGRPTIGDEAASTYSVRLPDDLVILADARSEIDDVSRGETIRRALIEYLTK